jgi:serine phosphatase RsbU (regulator of sigma subunit)
MSRRTSFLWIAGICLLLGCSGPLLNSAPELAGFLAFIPALAAGVGSVRQTVWVSAVVVVVTVVSVVSSPRSRWEVNVGLVLCSVLFGVFAVFVCRRRIIHTEATVRLQSAATAMQRHLLRTLPHAAEGIRLTGIYEPVQDESLVGGDVYDIADTLYGTRIMVADVQGKGLPALGASFAVVGAFREAAHREPTLTGLVEALEQGVVRQNGYANEAGEPERFVTALVLGLDGGAEVQMVNCGHPLPYLIGSRGVAHPPMPEADLPLGLGALVGGPRAVGSFLLEPNQTLLIYTDGLDEGRAPDGALFPLEERLAGLAYEPPDKIIESLYRQLRAFTANRQSDDITMLALHRRSVGGDEQASVLGAPLPGSAWG